MKLTGLTAAAALMITAVGGGVQAQEPDLIGTALVSGAWPGQFCQKVTFKGDRTVYALSASSIADGAIWEKVLQAQLLSAIGVPVKLSYYVAEPITCNDPNFQDFTHLVLVTGDPPNGDPTSSQH